MTIQHLSNKSEWRWIFVSVLLVSIAQLLMKLGMQTLASEWSSIEACGLFKCQWPTLLSLCDPLLYVFTGLSCYVVSMLCWIKGLQKIPLSKAYPVLSLSYVLVYVAAIFIPSLDEPFSWFNTLGISLILFGLYLICSKPIIRSSTNGLKTRNTQ
tara:strand:+ start:325 stop:789 length:465 start_codon:yes stop_codon:yes gene_type:complete